jgi:hypothetical protein
MISRTTIKTAWARLPRWQRRACVLLLPLIGLQLAGVAALAQQQVARAEGSGPWAVSRMVAEDKCLDYRIHSPRAACGSLGQQHAGLVGTAVTAQP